jgi:hypothetical protein
MTAAARQLLKRLAHRLTSSVQPLSSTSTVVQSYRQNLPLLLLLLLRSLT